MNILQNLSTPRILIPPYLPTTAHISASYFAKNYVHARFLLDTALSGQIGIGKFAVAKTADFQATFSTRAF
jgi:hypothetical protein